MFLCSSSFIDHDRFLLKIKIYKSTRFMRYLASKISTDHNMPIPYNLVKFAFRASTLTAKIPSRCSYQFGSQNVSMWSLMLLIAEFAKNARQWIWEFNTRGKHCDVVPCDHTICINMCTPCNQLFRFHNWIFQNIVGHIHRGFNIRTPHHLPFRNLCFPTVIKIYDKQRQLILSFLTRY